MEATFNHKEICSRFIKAFSDEEIEKLNKEELLGAINLIETLIKKELFNYEYKFSLMGVNLKLLSKLQTLKNHSENDDGSV